MSKNDLVVGHCSQLWEENIINKLTNQLSKNKTAIPLFWVDFDYQKSKKFGQKDSCMVHIHPTLKDNEYVKEALNDLIDYIRDNYKMEEL